MPIEFACECGKQFSVADEFAGKRTKCPVCGVTLAVPVPPAPSPKPEEDEDAAYQMLADAPDPDHESAPRLAPVPSRDELARSTEIASGMYADPKATRKHAKKLAAAERAEREYERLRIHLSNGFWGGIGTMFLAVVWFVGGLAYGRLFFYPPILFVIGMITAIKEFCGHPDD